METTMHQNPFSPAEYVEQDIKPKRKELSIEQITLQLNKELEGMRKDRAKNVAEESKNLLATNKKNFNELNMRYWFLNKPNKGIESEQLREYIQEKWKKKKFNNNLYIKEKKDFSKLVSKMNISKPLIY